MTRAFVTGLDGFTGRYLAAELKSAGYEVSGTSMDGRSGTYRCNLLEIDTLRKAVADARPDLVFHLAAIAFVAHSDIDNMYRTNIVGTRNLLAALEEAAKPKGVLVVSSANVYGNAPVGVITEDVGPAPANDYAVSKLAMEQMTSLWRDRLPITVVRPFNYTGVGQSTQFLLPKLVDAFRRKAEVIELGNLDVIRDFCDVRTVVRAYRLLLEANSAGLTLNVCSGIGHSLMDIVAMLHALTGHSPQIRVNPAFVRANEVRSLIGNRDALERVIGEMPLIPLRDTLAWMLGAD